MPVLRPLLAVLAAALVCAPAAQAAGDPIMPLSQVAKGMRCTALSVLAGTEISSFDAEVLDVVGGDVASEAPRILLRFSGPAIERTGVGPGFSGSPIFCPDGQGTQRNIGAISEAIGEFGGLTALATPIESILGEPVDPPAGTRPKPRDARTLAAPLSLSGLSPAVGGIYTRAARRGGRVLVSAPARPRAAAFPFQQLRPGSAMAAGLASGDVTAGSVGTVAYVDGQSVWAFGHPLDGAGRRSLFLQDAYVYTIVNNPVAVESAGTYKLAAPGHDVGILSGDGLSAVTGRLGVLPKRFPMKVVALDQDTGRRRVLNVQVADENAIGLPTGTSALALVGGSVIAQAATTVLGSAPARQTGEMCLRISVRQRKEPFRLCNRYVTKAGSSEEGAGVAAPMTTDFTEAALNLDAYNFAALDVTGVEVNLKVRRGLRQAFLLEAKGPSRVRRGRAVRVRVKVQEVRGPASWRTVRVRVPRGIPRGSRELVLEGTPGDSAGGLEVDLGELLFGSGDEEEADEAGPRTLDALAKAIAALTRFDGVKASFPEPGAGDDDAEEQGGAEGRARRGRKVLRDPEVRLSGTVRIPVEVR